jgi:tRNA/tmRNA/rRNA uracil-C5-methylase (TrmA/RlmC/RlmD family)
LRLGYSDHLVGSIIDEFELDPRREVVLDPFCGAGTTIVECKKQGISSIGIDANPSSCFATKVKTHWRVNEAELSSVLSKVERLYFLRLWCGGCSDAECREDHKAFR